MRGWTGEIFDIMNGDRIDAISSYCDRWCVSDLDKTGRVSVPSTAKPVRRRNDH